MARLVCGRGCSRCKDEAKRMPALLTVQCLWRGGMQEGQRKMKGGSDIEFAVDPYPAAMGLDDSRGDIKPHSKTGICAGDFFRPEKFLKDAPDILFGHADAFVTDRNAQQLARIDRRSYPDTRSFL